MLDATDDRVELLICTKCRAGAAALPSLGGDEAERPGAALHRLIEASGGVDGVAVTAVECLSNCDRGCSVALRGPGRWTYVYGDLDPASDLDVLMDGAARYRDTEDGLIPWRERPVHFRKHCIARIPPL